MRDAKEVRGRIMKFARWMTSSAAIAVVVAFAGCTPLPRVELEAYVTSSVEARKATNEALDVILPYERAVMRDALETVVAGIVVDPEEIAAAGEVFLIEPAVEPRIIVEDVRDPLDGGALDPLDDGSVDPLDGGPIEPVAGEGAADFDAPAPLADPPAVAADLATGLPALCAAPRGGDIPYCHAARSGYATIGDTPLVASVRNLSEVVDRFTAVLVAYSNGASFQFIRQDIGALTDQVGILGPLASAVGAASTLGAAPAAFKTAADAVSPIAQAALNVKDRESLKTFLIDNHDLVDAALREISASSTDLYGNVSVGTVYLINADLSKADALRDRQQKVRALLANWTVLVDEQRRTLARLKGALVDSGGFELRLRNLNEDAVKARFQAQVIQDQVKALGALP